MISCSLIFFQVRTSQLRTERPPRLRASRSRSGGNTQSSRIARQRAGAASTGPRPSVRPSRSHAACHRHGVRGPSVPIRPVPAASPRTGPSPGSDPDERLPPASLAATAPARPASALSWPGCGRLQRRRPHQRTPARSPPRQGRRRAPTCPPRPPPIAARSPAEAHRRPARTAPTWRPAATRRHRRPAAAARPGPRPTSRDLGKGDDTVRATPPANGAPGANGARRRHQARRHIKVGTPRSPQ